MDAVLEDFDEAGVDPIEDLFEVSDPVVGEGLVAVDGAESADRGPACGCGLAALADEAANVAGFGE